MTKLLLLALLVAGVVLLVRAGARAARRRADAAAAPKARGEEDILPCAHCGLHLPRSEGVPSGGRFYCSDEHRRVAAIGRE
jgi:uncharacterized protein